MLAPTWDSLVLLALIGFATLGIVLRYSKVTPLLIGIYISLAVTNEVGLELFRLLRRLEITGFDTTLFVVRLLLFVLLTFLLFLEGESIAPGPENGGGMTGSIKGGIFGAIAGALVITSIVGFMGAAERTDLLNKSSLANTMNNLRLWLLIPFPLMLAAGSLIRRFR